MKILLNLLECVQVAETVSIKTVEAGSLMVVVRITAAGVTKVKLISYA